MSIHPEIYDLIQAELDGVATDAERIRLRDAIASDAEVRDEYRRLRGLCDVLAQVQPEPPPARLAPAVMRSVRSRRGASRGGLGGSFSAFWPGRHLALRYAYALAAGAILGVLGVHLASGGGRFGSPVAERDAGATIAPARPTPRLSLAPAGVHGFATVRPSATGNAIGVDLGNTEPVELVLRYDPTKDGGKVDILVLRDGTATEAGTLALPGKQ
jgi:anti-sigma factor RsiW